MRLHFNLITDVSPLGGLPNLRTIWLHANPELRDVQPLIDNPGVAAANINVVATSVDCADVATLKANRALVRSDCPD